MSNGRKIVAGTAVVAAIAIVAQWTSGGDIEEDVLSRAHGVAQEAGADWAEFETNGRRVTLMGRAPDESSRDTLKSMVEDSWGVSKLVDKSDVVPVAAPFVWKLTKPAPTVVVSGAVPNTNIRQAIAEQARRTFGQAVKDGSDLGRGAPENGWADAAKVALAQIASLNHGEIVLSDTQMTVKGEAPDAATAFRLRRALARAMPDGFSAVAEITTPEAEAVQPLGSVEACQDAFNRHTETPTGWFGEDGPFIAADAFRRLDGIALVARQCAEFEIDIVGVTNESGDFERDKRIGRIQAMAIRDYLVASGANDISINAVGQADPEPTITDGDEGEVLERGISFTVRTKDGS